MAGADQGPDRRIGAIVLAGGRSSRFGRDKLVEPIDGRPMLIRTVAAVAAVAADIVVVTGVDADPAVTAGLPPAIRIVHDDVAYGGPLLGLLAGLAALRPGSVAVVAGGDMPWLRSDVLASLVAALDPGHDASALELAGRGEQLPVALRRDAAFEVVRRLTDLGERRLGALLGALDVALIAEETWRILDPAGDTLRDVDTPGDLAAPG